MQKIVNWLLKEFNKGNVIALIILLLITPICSILFPIVYLIEIVIMFRKNRKIKKIRGEFKNEK